MTRMLASILGFILGTIVALFLYTYRWNVINPLKSNDLLVDSLNRKFYYHLPKNLDGNPKLIIVLHGSGMPAQLIQIFTGHRFDELADKTGNTIVVYPQGYQNHWNDCRKNAPFTAKGENIDDVKFMEYLIEYFTGSYHVNPDQVFAVGYSNGGQMAMKLARQRPEWFRAFAVMNANLPVSTNDACEDVGEPVSMMLINGVSDPINPYEGGEVILKSGQNFGEVLSTENTLKHFLEINETDCRQFSTIAYPDENPTVLRRDYNMSPTRKNVSLINILNGGHTIPNPNFRIPIKALGNLNRDIDAPALIWDFLMCQQ